MHSQRVALVDEFRDAPLLLRPALEATVGSLPPVVVRESRSPLGVPRTVAAIGDERAEEYLALGLYDDAGQPGNAQHFLDVARAALALHLHLLELERAGR